MKFQVVCPDCDAISSTNTDPGGRRVKCPKCGGLFRVSKAVSARPAEPEPPPVPVPPPEAEPFVASVAPPNDNRYAAPEAEQKPVGAPTPYWSTNKVAVMIALVPVLLFASCVAIYFATKAAMTPLPTRVVNVETISESLNRLEKLGYEHFDELTYLDYFRQVQYAPPGEQDPSFSMIVYTWLRDQRIARIKAACLTVKFDRIPQDSAAKLEDDIFSLIDARDDYQRAASNRKRVDTEEGVGYFGKATTSDGWRIETVEYVTSTGGMLMITLTNREVLDDPSAPALLAELDEQR